MKKISLKIYLRLIGASFILGGICLVALVSFTETSHELCLLEAAGTIIASFCLGLYILMKKIPSPAASATTPPTTAPAAKPAAKKKFNWEFFWIFATGIIMISGFVLGVYFIAAPIVEFFIPDKPPAFNPSAIQTLGNDPLTPYIPPGISSKGLTYYNNVLVDLQPGQKFRIATLVKGQHYTWKLNNSFCIVADDGKGGEQLIAEPPSSEIVQESTGDGDLWIKSACPLKGIVRVFSDKNPVFRTLPLVSCLLSKNCNVN